MTGCFRPATPGTVIVIAATILLILASVSTPIVKSIYFLNVSIVSSSATINITLGTFGYAVGNVGFGPSLGYSLTAASLLGIENEIDLPNTLIKGLTYVLILHPIAAGFAGIAALCGIFGHLSEMSYVLSLVATWFASIGCTLSALAFAFDMACFTIARRRLGDVQSDQVAVSAAYGNAIWITLAGFVLLLAAGCCFGCGRRMIGSKRASRGDYKPAVDPGYASDTRQNALLADRLRRTDQSYSSLPNKEGGLPAFSEALESVPLQSYGRATNGQYDDDEQTIAGVGRGYGRRDDSDPLSTATGGAGEEPQSPSHVEGFQSMYPARGQEQDIVSPSSQYPAASHFPMSAVSEYPPMAHAQPYYNRNDGASPATSYAPSSIPQYAEARQSVVPFLPYPGAAATTAPGHSYGQPSYSYEQPYDPAPRTYYTSQAGLAPSMPPASSGYAHTGPPTYRSQAEDPAYSPYAEVNAVTQGYYEATPEMPYHQTQGQHRWQ